MPRKPTPPAEICVIEPFTNRDRILAILDQRPWSGYEYIAAVIGVSAALIKQKCGARNIRIMDDHSIRRLLDYATDNGWRISNAQIWQEDETAPPPPPIPRLLPQAGLPPEERRKEFTANIVAAIELMAAYAGLQPTSICRKMSLDARAWAQMKNGRRVADPQDFPHYMDAFRRLRGLINRNRETNNARIRNLVVQRPWLTRDEISALSGINPRDAWRIRKQVLLHQPVRNDLEAMCDNASESGFLPRSGPEAWTLLSGLPPMSALSATLEQNREYARPDWRRRIGHAQDPQANDGIRG